MAYPISCNEASSKLPKNTEDGGKTALPKLPKQPGKHPSHRPRMAPGASYTLLCGLKNISPPGGHWPWTTAGESQRRQLTASVVLTLWREYGCYAESMFLAVRSSEFLVLFQLPQIICSWTTFPDSSQSQRKQLADYGARAFSNSSDNNISHQHSQLY